ncbi:MAG: sugar transferase [Bacteroidales bacterium]|nr:sugar transferase [Bacteroidales bacterium]
MNRKLQLSKYIISDLISAIVGWIAFFIHWKLSLGAIPDAGALMHLPDRQFYNGLVLAPFFWPLIHYITGYYNDVFRKSRLFEFGQTFGNVLVGTLALYFLLGINKTEVLYHLGTFSLFFSMFLFQFVITYVPRLIITTITTHKVHNGIIGFNTLLIGSNSKALEAWKELVEQKKSSGNKFIGFVSVNHNSQNVLGDYLLHLGNVEDIHQIIKDRNVEEVIIAIENVEHDMINLIINKLINANVVIKAIPSMYDILTGRVRMSSILGTPLISVSHNLMPAWQENMKTFMDYLVASLALIITLPLNLFLIAGIKLSSKGPVFYSHERIGRYGKPFSIYKFRSMYVDAEKGGPELSSKNDDRITPFGRFMRKSRLDEIPNFFNVLKGEMSLVGPRPERKYFIDQITQNAPHYLHLLKVKPGITSWGQVKYGYAENVDQMVQRLKYDLIYLDNMSLYVDFKIIIYTILTIIKRTGI